MQAKNQMACLPSAALHTELLPLILNLSLQPQHLDQSVLPAKDSARRFGLHHNCVMSTQTEGGCTYSGERQSMSTAVSATASDNSESAKQEMQAAYNN